jgi:hypothetical protein
MLNILTEFIFQNKAINVVKYISKQKKRYKDFFEIYFYAKTKTIVYYHLRQCLRETRLSSQNKQ